MLSRKYPTMENKQNTNNSEIEILMRKGKLRETITQKNLSLIKMILRNHGQLLKI